MSEQAPSRAAPSAARDTRHPSPRHQNGPYRVVTWNVRSLRDDADAVASVLRTLKPDVACLQECPASLRHPLALLRVARASGLTVGVGGRGPVRVAVLVRERATVSATFTWSLSEEPGMQRRFVAGVRANWGGIAVSLLSFHLGLSAEQRVRHAQEIRSRAADPKVMGRLILCGDLNEADDQPAWRLLAAGLSDLGAAGGPTFPTRRPRHRIDTIMVGKELASEAGAAVPGNEMLGPHAALLRTATDHLPVVADLHT